ncbi:MAG: PilZ domain-containing protein, partial [Spirochaetales bacterium]|nr:PilZ domain-containing protein [Spirochaetales bacterium]
ISSEIWCPIIYYQYVVGYIYVTDRSGGSFDVSMVDYLWDFSRILAFNLKQTGYFSGEKKSEAAPGHQAQVLDMSPGGTLISLPRSEIRTPIKEGSVFSVDVLMGDKTVNCSVKVVRRYEESEAISYGMTFLNLSSQDVMQIYEGLYRKPYNERDSLAFEQS